MKRRLLVTSLLTTSQKRAVMLEDLKDELKQYKKLKGMEWWTGVLERKIKEIQGECGD
jgi:hypothetical protein